VARRWWPRRRRSQVEGRAIQWPFDVGPPGIIVGGAPSVKEALSLPPFFAAVRLLAGVVASLPLQTYRDTPKGRVRVSTPQLFAAPAPGQTLYEWLHACMTSLLLWGNAYGLVTSRDGFDYPTAIVWLDPDDMRVEDDESNPARCRYFYNGRELLAEDVVHIRANLLPGCCKGVSVLEQFPGVIAAGLAAQRYGQEWFAAGGFPPGTMQNTQRTLDATQAEEIKARVSRAIRAREALVYGNDWQYNAIVVPPEQAQFIQTMQAYATQIAAIFGVPPERIGGSRGSSLTYATQEQDDISFYSNSVRGWCSLLESAFFELLPARQYVRFNLDAPIRTDLKTRHEVFRIDREIGFASIDELRAIDDLEPLPDGAGADFAPLSGASPAPAPAAPEPPALPARPRAVS
jgi:HK97 family phage portal protein